MITATADELENMSPHLQQAFIKLQTDNTNLLRENGELGARVEGYRKRNKTLANRVETLKADLATAEYLAQEAISKGHRAAQEAAAMKDKANEYLDKLNEEHTVSVNLTLSRGQVVGMRWR